MPEETASQPLLSSFIGSCLDSLSPTVCHQDEVDGWDRFVVEFGPGREYTVLVKGK